MACKRQDLPKKPQKLTVVAEEKPLPFGWLKMASMSASMISKPTPKALTRCACPILSTKMQTTQLQQVVEHIKSLNRKAIGVVADVSKRSEVETLVQKSVDVLGPLDVMVANAGIAQVKPALELTEEDMQCMININLFGVFNCYQIAAKQMIKQGTKGKLLGAAR